MVNVKKVSAPRVRKTRTKTRHECRDCDFWAFTPSDLVKHVRTHTGEKPFCCDFGECTKAFSQKGSLNLHMKRHFGVKPHVCAHPGCDFRSLDKRNLESHRRTHSGEKPYSCHLCGTSFSDQSAMRRHEDTHAGIKKHKCTFNGCDYSAYRLSSVVIHFRTHTGEKPFPCSFNGCDYRSCDASTLVKHERTHTGEKPFVCHFGGCDYKSADSGSLVSHKATHTIEGQIRRKKQEHRVNKILKEWGYDVDPELTIKAKSSNCLADTDRYYARIDFTIINCTNAILILEVDENAHSWYNLSCEFSRMTDVQASLALAGYTAPIYWLRYNPNGKYHIGGEQVKMHRPKREAALKKHLAKLCSPDFEPKHQMNLHYMFYDLGSSEAGPAIMSDIDFPAVVKPYVSWCV